MTVSIVLADDHPVVRRGMRATAGSRSRTSSVVGEAGDGLETTELVERLKPDVLVLDLMMPGLSGSGGPADHPPAVAPRPAWWFCPCTATMPSWPRHSRTARTATCSRAASEENLDPGRAGGGRRPAFPQPPGHRDAPSTLTSNSPGPPSSTRTRR